MSAVRGWISALCQRAGGGAAVQGAILGEIDPAAGIAGLDEAAVSGGEADHVGAGVGDAGGGLIRADIVQVPRVGPDGNVSHLGPTFQGYGTPAACCFCLASGVPPTGSG